jgi:hypothetical protein
MRTLLAVLLILTATPAFAACEPMRPSSWGNETLAQAAYAACLQAELSRRSIEDQRFAQLQAEYQLKLKMLELQLRQQQPLILPSLPPIVPAF